MDKANAAGGVWASPKWAVAAYTSVLNSLKLIELVEYYRPQVLSSTF